MRKPNQIYVRSIGGKKMRVKIMSYMEAECYSPHCLEFREKVLILGEVPRYFYLDGVVCKPSNNGFCRLPSKKVLAGIADGKLKLGDGIAIPRNGPHGCAYTVAEIVKEADGKREKIWALFNEVPF